MIKKVITISPNESIIKAAELMTKHNIGSLVVLEEGKIIGIITERDFVERVVSKGLSVKRTKVRKVMSSPVITCKPETTISEAMHIMENYRVRHLPIVDKKGKLLGIISSRDL